MLNCFFKRNCQCFFEGGFHCFFKIKDCFFKISDGLVGCCRFPLSNAINNYDKWFITTYIYTLLFISIRKYNPPVKKDNLKQIQILMIYILWNSFEIVIRSSNILSLYYHSTVILWASPDASFPHECRTLIVSIYILPLLFATSLSIFHNWEVAPLIIPRTSELLDWSVFLTPIVVPLPSVLL